MVYIIGNDATPCLIKETLLKLLGNAGQICSNKTNFCSGKRLTQINIILTLDSDEYNVFIL